MTFESIDKPATTPSRPPAASTNMPSPTVGSSLPHTQGEPSVRTTPWVGRCPWTPGALPSASGCSRYPYDRSVSTGATTGSETPAALSSVVAAFTLLLPSASLAWLALAAVGVPSGVDAVELDGATQAALSSTAVLLAVSVVVRRWLQVSRRHKRWQSTSLGLMGAMLLVVALGCLAFLRSWVQLYMPVGVPVG